MDFICYTISSMNHGILSNTGPDGQTEGEVVYDTYGQNRTPDPDSASNVNPIGCTQLEAMNDSGFSKHRA